MIDRLGLEVNMRVGARGTEEQGRDVDTRSAAALGKGFGAQKIRTTD